MFLPSGYEWIVAFVVALIVFGPRRLPEIARALARFTKMIRQATQEVKEQIDLISREVDSPSRPPKQIHTTYTPPEPAKTSPATPPTGTQPVSAGEGYGGYGGYGESQTQTNADSPTESKTEEIQDAELADEDDKTKKNNPASGPNLSDDYVSD